jgi:hypothetical protein
MVVHLIAQARITRLIEALELVEAQRESIRHDEAMEENGKAGLAKSVHLSRLAENLRACRYEQVLAVV